MPAFTTKHIHKRMVADKRQAVKTARGREPFAARIEAGLNFQSIDRSPPGLRRSVWFPACLLHHFNSLHRCKDGSLRVY